MKNVKLKFIGTGVCSFYQAHVCIYDECNNLVYEGDTNNGCLCVNLCINRLYKVYACTRCERLFGAFYVRCNKCEYCFPFTSAFSQIEEEDNITFQLTDAVYENLPIMRGDMILWQR